MSMEKKIIKERQGLSYGNKLAQAFLDKLEVCWGKKKSRSNILLLSLHLFSSNNKFSSLLLRHLLLEFAETSTDVKATVSLTSPNTCQKQHQLPALPSLQLKQQWGGSRRANKMDGKWLSAEVCSAMSGKVQAEDVGVKVLPCDLAFLGENL